MVLGAELINTRITFDSVENRVQFDGLSKSVRGGMEEKSGKLKLHLSKNQTEQQPSQPSQHVILKLYAAVPCPFAVIFPDKSVCPKHCGIIQLKNFSLEVNDNSTDFTLIIKNGMEGVRLLRFSSGSGEERDSWLNSFQNVAQSTCSRDGGNCKTARNKNINSRLPSLEEVSEDIETQEEENNTVLKSCENVLQDNCRRKRPLTPRRRVVEAPVLEQIREEEDEDNFEFDSIENRIFSNSPRRSSLKDCLSEISTIGGRSL